MARFYTNKVLEAVEEGTLDAQVALRMALCWMSEDDVAGMVEAELEDLFEYEDEGEDEGEEGEDDLL
jgi:hypothetical protein